MKPPSYPHRRCLFTLLLVLGAGCKEPGMMKKVEQTPFLALSGSQSAILSLNVERMRLLSIFESSRDAILKDKKRSDWWESLTGKTGFNPLTGADRLILGTEGSFKIEDPTENAVLICTGRFLEPQRIVDGFLAFAGEDLLDKPPPFKKADREGIETYTTKAPLYSNPDKIVELNFAFPSPALMVFTRSGQKLAETLDVIQGKAPGIQKNDAWQKRLGTINMGAMLWSLGEFPAAVNQWLTERVKTEPELKGLNGLANARNYTATVEVDKDYLLRAGLICDGIDPAKALSEDIKKARKIVPRMLAHFLGEGSPRIPLWQEQFDAVFISNEFSTTNLTLRVEKRAVDDFVRKLTSPAPTPKPKEIPAPFLQPTPNASPRPVN